MSAPPWVGRCWGDVLWGPCDTVYHCCIAVRRRLS